MTSCYHCGGSVEDMFRSGRLFALELANNRMTKLPSWVNTKAANITVINLEGNQFQDLPSAASLPPHLTTLRLGNNPISNASAAQRKVREADGSQRMRWGGRSSWISKSEFA